MSSLQGGEALVTTGDAGEPIRLPKQLALAVQHAASATGDPVHPVRTTLYTYQVFHRGKPLVEFHFHPKSKIARCHVHVRPGGPEGQLLRKAHIPTSRVSFEDVLLMLIEDFAVPAKPRAVQRLRANRERFERGQRWTATAS